jgi:hypothetical protein
MANKQSVGLTFFNQFQKLTETEKEKFSRICNKILDKNFLIRQKESDKEDYFFVVGHLTLFQNYFMLMDYMVTHYEADQIVALSTEANRNRTRLRRNDTIMLLVLRLLYQKKSKEATQLNQILVSVKDIQEELDRTSLFKGKIPKTELQTTMRMLKSYSLIDFQSSNLINDDTRVEIYPSLLRVVNIDDMTKLETQLNAYSNGGDDDEDDDQD